MLAVEPEVKEASRVLGVMHHRKGPPQVCGACNSPPRLGGRTAPYSCDSSGTCPECFTTWIHTFIIGALDHLACLQKAVLGLDTQRLCCSLSKGSKTHASVVGAYQASRAHAARIQQMHDTVIWLSQSFKPQVEISNPDGMLKRQ